MSDEVVVEIVESQVVEVLLSEGPRGPQGLIGLQGVAGSDGSDGSQGVQGETGPAVDTTTLSVQQSQVAGLVSGLAGKAGLTGNTFTGTQAVSSGGSGQALVLSASPSQSSNILEVNANSGAGLFRVNSAGVMRSTVYTEIGYGANYNDPASGVSSALRVSASWASVGLIVGTTYPSAVGAVIRGAAGQTANLQEWQDSSGNVKAGVTNGGDFISANGAKLAGAVVVGSTGGVLGSLTVRTLNSEYVGAVIRGAAGQTANLQEWQDSSGNVMSRVSSSGAFITSTNSFISAGGGHAQFVNATSSNVVLAVRGAAGQTANLQEWQNSAGNAVAKVDATGTLTAANFLQGTGSPLGVVSANVGAI
jgi:hypothetical protein